MSDPIYRRILNSREIERDDYKGTSFKHRNDRVKEYQRSRHPAPVDHHDEDGDEYPDLIRTSHLTVEKTSQMIPSSYRDQPITRELLVELFKRTPTLEQQESVIRYLHSKWNELERIHWRRHADRRSSIVEEDPEQDPEEHKATRDEPISRLRLLPIPIDPELLRDFLSA